MATNYNPSIVIDGLRFCLDAANIKSYPGSGTTWTDLIGGLSGTLENGTSFSSSDGGCLDFDGSDDQVSLGTDGAAIVNGLSELTLEMWFNSDVIDNDRGLIFGSNSSNNNDNGFCLRYDTAGGSGGGDDVIKSGFGTNNASGVGHSAIESSASIQSTDWTNILVTCDVGTSINLYKNGSLDTPTSTLNGGSQTTVSNCDNLVIGRGSKVQLWEGKISIVRIYNRILTTSEVFQNYNALKGRFGL